MPLPTGQYSFSDYVRMEGTSSGLISTVQLAAHMLELGVYQCLSFDGTLEG